MTSKDARYPADGSADESRDDEEMPSTSDFISDINRERSTMRQGDEEMPSNSGSNTDDSVSGDDASSESSTYRESTRILQTSIDAHGGGVTLGGISRERSTMRQGDEEMPSTSSFNADGSDRDLEGARTPQALAEDFGIDRTIAGRNREGSTSERQDDEDMPTTSRFNGVSRADAAGRRQPTTPEGTAPRRDLEGAQILQALVEEFGIDAAIAGIYDEGVADAVFDEADPELAEGNMPFLMIAPDDLRGYENRHENVPVMPGRAISLRNVGNVDSSDDSESDNSSHESDLIELPVEIHFDTNLPAEHSYFGANTSRVRGVNYLEVGSSRRMYLFMHHYVLLPGEVLPFMVGRHLVDDLTSEVDGEGALFGIIFPFLNRGLPTEDALYYGVTCQIYERGNVYNQYCFKSRALQRFVVLNQEFVGVPEYISQSRSRRCYGIVKILPEYYLNEPLKELNMGAMKCLRGLKHASGMYQRFQTNSQTVPAFLYKTLDLANTVNKAKTVLEKRKIDTMPTCPIQLSFWLMRNVHIPEELLNKLFITDVVNERLKRIADSIATSPTENSMFYCRICNQAIANCRDLFAMSKHGIQTQFCNSGGVIHETNTVYRVLANSTILSGTPSTEFSWFPGYQWHIIVCIFCGHHLGWQFKATEPDLLPKVFYGLSGSTVTVVQLGESAAFERAQETL